MLSTCTEPVSYVDNNGYVYCLLHGIDRKFSRPCRKLTAAELRRLLSGETITY